MRAARVIGQVVAATEEVKRGQETRPDATDPSDAGDRLASKWFDAALAASPEKAMTVAHLLRVSESMVSHMRAGRKSTPIRALFGLDKRAVLAFVEALLADLVPEHEILRREQVTPERARRLVARAAMEWEPIRAVIVRRAAQAEGIEPEELERALAGK
jgi:hypothetical protein